MIRTLASRMGDLEKRRSKPLDAEKAMYWRISNMTHEERLVRVAELEAKCTPEELAEIRARHPNLIDARWEEGSPERAAFLKECDAVRGRAREIGLQRGIEREKELKDAPQPEPEGNGAVKQAVDEPVSEPGESPGEALDRFIALHHGDTSLESAMKERELIEQVKASQLRAAARSVRGRPWEDAGVGRLV